MPGVVMDFPLPMFKGTLSRSGRQETNEFDVGPT